MPTSPVAQRPRSAGQTGSTCSGVMYKDNRHGDLMQHFRGFLSGPNRCPGCAGHGITDRGTTCKACLGDGKLTSAVRGYSVTTLYGAAPVTVRPTTSPNSS